MAEPILGNFKLYNGKLVTGSQYNDNLSTTINFLTTDYDVTFGSVVADTFRGDVSECTGFPSEDFVVEAGEAITAGQVVRLSGGLAYKATNATLAGVTNVVGIAAETVSAGEDVAIQRATSNTLTGLSTGTTYWVGVAGAVTSTRPIANAVQLGIALSPTAILLDIKVPPFQSIGCSLYLDANQTIPTGGGVDTSWGGEYFDIGDMHNDTYPYDIQIPYTGVYLFNIINVWTGNGTGDRGIVINGTAPGGSPTIQFYSVEPVANANKFLDKYSVQLLLEGGSTAQIKALQYSGGDLALIGGPNKLITTPQTRCDVTLLIQQ